VIVRFVDISAIVDHHWLNVLFIIIKMIDTFQLLKC